MDLSREAPTESSILELEKRMEELEKRYLGSLEQKGQTPFTPTSTTAKKPAEISDPELFREKPSTTTKLPILQPICFNGGDLDEFYEEYARWMRLSGVCSESEEVKIDWLVEFCSPKIRPLVKKNCER